MLTIRYTTGSVHLDGCDAAALSIETSTGDVAGSLLTEKVFAAETSTGKIDVPKSTTGDLCEIKTSAGSIRMDFARCVLRRRAFARSAYRPGDFFYRAGARSIILRGERKNAYGVDSMGKA